jgi:protein required for attachment to host cells
MRVSSCLSGIVQRACHAGHEACFLPRERREEERMGPVWIVLADTNRARVYAQASRGGKLALVDELSHPKAALDASELETDKPGKKGEANLGGVGGGPGAISAVKHPLSPHTDPEEVELQKWARKLGDFIEAGRKQNAFAELVLFMAPKALGQVRKELADKTRERIVHAAAEDLMSLDDGALAAKLARAWFVPDQPFA